MTLKYVFIILSTLILLSGCVSLVEQQPQVEPVNSIPEDTHTIYYIDGDLKNNEKTGEVFNYIVPKYKDRISNSTGYTGPNNYETFWSESDELFYFLNLDNLEEVIFFSGDNRYTTIRTSNYGGIIIKSEISSRQYIQNLKNENHLSSETEVLNNYVVYKSENGGYVKDIGRNTLLFTRNLQVIEDAMVARDNSNKRVNENIIEDKLSQEDNSEIMILGEPREDNPIMGSLIKGNPDYINIAYSTVENHQLNAKLYTDNNTQVRDDYYNSIGNLQNIIRSKNDIQIDPSILDNVGVSSNQEYVEINIELSSDTIQDFF